MHELCLHVILLFSEDISENKYFSSILSVKRTTESLTSHKLTYI